MRILLWTIVGLFLLAAFAMTLMVPPQEIFTRLQQIAIEKQDASATVHIIFFVVVVFGIAIRRIREPLFAAFIAFVSMSAAIVAITHRLTPNIIVFVLYVILIGRAYLRRKLNFAFMSLPLADRFFGVVALIFGFWYLHWVGPPVALTALYYSPIGILNCPTMLTVTGFLILTSQPRSRGLEAFVGISTLYFGLFGIIKLGAWVDIALVACSLFMILRLVLPRGGEQVTVPSAA